MKMVECYLCGMKMFSVSAYGTSRCFNIVSSWFWSCILNHSGFPTFSCRVLDSLRFALVLVVVVICMDSSS